VTSAQPDSEIATAAAEPGRAAFRRVLLKLSGEALMGDQPYGVDPARVEAIAREVTRVRRDGVETVLVIGAGNITPSSCPRLRSSSRSKASARTRRSERFSTIRSGRPSSAIGCRSSTDPVVGHQRHISERAEQMASRVVAVRHLRLTQQESMTAALVTLGPRSVRRRAADRV
jgi:acetylglutamate kinase